ncbi:Alanine--tRNA ligase [Hondaea fermentalgiana]|uniref:Alanine--tRNA ligase n=1 Tax=Hondaea fermentalgiana TaxID=2315210 RepID=A0A2R5GJ58_9STRA|nr:Alanine--tRNA ligase [Hondaea fermentalgiana]|eukprot:GBG30922.1 Alanine--tRNA ligase [Hondaea fermentalgiana]
MPCFPDAGRSGQGSLVFQSHAATAAAIPSPTSNALQQERQQHFQQEQQQQQQRPQQQRQQQSNSTDPRGDPVGAAGAAIDKSREENEKARAQAKSWAGYQRVCVVTGANRGLGLALVEALLRPRDDSPASEWLGPWRQDGFDKVFALVRSPSEATLLEQLAMERPGAVRIVKYDQADEHAIKLAADTIRREATHIDLLINNAGLMTRPTGLRCVRSKLLVDSFIVNAAGPMVLSRLLLPLVRLGRGKRIINVSSAAGSIGGCCGGQAKGHYEYKMSKAALNMGTSVMAQELVSEGILVAAYNPGGVCTETLKRWLGPRATPDFGWVMPCDAAEKMMAVVDYISLKDHSGAFLNHRYLDEGDKEYKTLLKWLFYYFLQSTDEEEDDEDEQEDELKSKDADLKDNESRFEDANRKDEADDADDAERKDGHASNEDTLLSEMPKAGSRKGPAIEGSVLNGATEKDTLTFKGVVESFDFFASLLEKVETSLDDLQKKVAGLAKSASSGDVLIEDASHIVTAREKVERFKIFTSRVLKDAEAAARPATEFMVLVERADAATTASKWVQDNIAKIFCPGGPTLKNAVKDLPDATREQVMVLIKTRMGVGSGTNKRISAVLNDAAEGGEGDGEPRQPASVKEAKTADLDGSCETVLITNSSGAMITAMDVRDAMLCFTTSTRSIPIFDVNTGKKLSEKKKISLSRQSVRVLFDLFTDSYGSKLSVDVQTYLVYLSVRFKNAKAPELASKITVVQLDMDGLRSKTDLFRDTPSWAVFWVKGVQKMAHGARRGFRFEKFLHRFGITSARDSLLRQPFLHEIFKADMLGAIAEMNEQYFIRFHLQHLRLLRMDETSKQQQQQQSGDRVAELEAQVQALQEEIKEKDKRILQLSREVPLGLKQLKTKRLGLEPRMMQQPGDGNDNVEWPEWKIREKFVSFFEESHKHTFWPSSPVVPHNDPTLLFTNAGMNQFKPLFLGQADPNTAMSKLKRAVNLQKCIRAGGKHNDLDDCGRDGTHLTSFLMAGNWSFGDFFKEGAIAMAWELLTEVFKLNPDNLYASYFGGDEKVPVDEEARQIWLKYLPESHVLPFDAKDNFWEMGDTGPCGPCSEIHYDRIGNREAGHLVNDDAFGGEVTEIWNLVFIQFNRKADGTLESLPEKHVDTGMGFERLAMALQKKTSAYDTDVFTPLLDAIAKVAVDVPPYGGKMGADDVGNVDMAYRVVADHIRTLSFAIADGAFPSNEGRGYVLRRILRRAVRYGQEVLNMPRGGFAKLSGVFIAQMREAFPELGEKEQLIYEVILDEEETFARTLRKGTIRFQKEADKVKAAGGTVIPGKVASFLYLTMGFPIDLTELMAEEAGLTVDIDGYNLALQKHVEASQAVGSSGDGNGIRMLEAKETAYLEDNLGLSPTDHSEVYNWYNDVEGATVKAIFDGSDFVEQVSIADCAEGKQYGFILDKSNFYYESGGQLADTGFLEVENTDVCVSVRDCQSSKGFKVHAGAVQKRSGDDDDEAEAGTPARESRDAIKVGDKVTCRVNFERRGDLAKNHTSTHLLNFALRKAVSADTDQKGSMVSSDKLRFDFNAQKAITLEQLVQVEKIVREKISESLPVHTQVVPLADARRISSLRAVFGETYPDPVRVVSIGPKVEEVIEDPLNEKWINYSIELCGGTHLGKSSEARSFSLVSESALAKGIRRVVCVTGEAAYKAARDAEALRARVEEANGLSDAALQDFLKSLMNDVSKAVISVSEKHELTLAVDALSRRLAELQKAAQHRVVTLLVDEAKAAAEAGKGFVVFNIDDASTNAAKVVQDANKKLKKTPIAILALQGNKETDAVTFSAFAPPKAQEKLDVKEWVTFAGEPCEARGGGKGGTFNGKGKGVAQISSCLERGTQFASEKLA